VAVQRGRAGIVTAIRRAYRPMCQYLSSTVGEALHAGRFGEHAQRQGRRENVGVVATHLHTRAGGRVWGARLAMAVSSMT